MLGFVSAWLPNLAGASFPPTPAWVIHNAQVRAIPYYLEQLDEPLSTKRLAALKELAQVGSDADEAIPKLIALLDKDEVPRVRAVSAAILGMMGRRAEAATPALIRGLDHENKFVRAASAQALGSMGTQAEAAISKLIELAKDDYSDVQKEAISALGKIGPAAENALSILTERLQDKDSDIRSRAALAIGGLGEKGKVAASALTELLRAGVKAAARSAAAPEPAPDPRNTRMVSYYTVNDDLVVGCAAARALGELGSVSGMAVPDLVQAIAPRRSENPSENYVITELRIDAMLALANIGGLTREAISQLIESLGDGGSISGSGQPRVRKAVEEDDNSYYPDMIMIGDAAAYALGRIGGDATGSLLQLARNNLQEIKDKPAYDNAIRDSWPRLQNVFIALGAAGGHDPHVISFLIESLQDVNARQYSLLALGEIGPAASEAIPAILKLKPKTDSDWFPYAHVLNAYAKIENPDKAAATLMDYACDTACPVEKRCKAIRTLQQCESAVRDWTPIIQLIGAKGEQTIIRKESVRLSARIKPLGHAAISKLIGVLDEHLEEERGDWWGTT
ncbi:HEAT repeat domain-containing protein, partial [Candidatus Sumerlaeota bacterium]|nr:HEAT repeat domain-containing protein [Candidatus Sumerlaeota bacterium]